MEVGFAFVLALAGDTAFSLLPALAIPRFRLAGKGLGFSIVCGCLKGVLFSVYVGGQTEWRWDLRLCWRSRVTPLFRYILLLCVLGKPASACSCEQHRSSVTSCSCDSEVPFGRKRFGFFDDEWGSEVCGFFGL